ncbi:MAG: aminopeptidase P N-terminal domain-containing protein [Spirochaetia bacterium]|nr:aminopeptidase P N-terminal domain-containing protein [Spirochaetia bacterium]
MEYKNKLEQIAKKLEPDSILILFSPEKKVRNRDVHYEYRNSSDFIYLTGCNEPEMILCLTSEIKISIFMKFPDVKLERWTGKMLSPEKVELDLNLDKSDVRESKNFWDEIHDLLKNKKTIYLDYNENHENIQRLIVIINDLNKNSRDEVCGPEKIINLSHLLHESRVIKSPNEVKKIKEAIQITAKGFMDVMKFTRSCFNKSENYTLFEYNVKARIESSFNESGATNLAYPTIVASGNNANYLHYENCDKLILPNELILIDAGCELFGYASDITRTIPASGKFSDPQKEIYNIVLGAQKIAIKNCTPGNTFEKIHECTVKYIVENLWELGFFKELLIDNVDINNNDLKLIKPESIKEVIDKKYYRTYFMHYTSHYLGLDVHDVGKYYINGSSRKFEPGMIFTVEPGIYISEDYHFVPEKYRGIGIRIEDNILITKNGNEVLSENIPREVYEIENIG